MKKPMKRSYQLEITRQIKELRIELSPLLIRSDTNETRYWHYPKK